jgi:hypothetical protein
MSVDSPFVMPNRVREWLVGSPGDNFIVIKRVGHTKYIGGSVLGIVIDSTRGEVALRPGFKVKPEYCHGVGVTPVIRQHQVEPTKEEPDD